MATEKQIAANQRNSRLSTGPTSALGRARSAMNAYKDGLRSKKRVLLRDESYAFENRKQKWMAKANPSDDMGEFLVNQIVCASFEIEHAVGAIWERIDRQIETSEDSEIESVNALGERLLFDRCGPRGLVGNGPDIKTKHERKLKTSLSGVAEDPDSPRKLVQELKNSAFGCMWLRGHWEELKAKLEPDKHWNGPDRFLAVRLLGRQPADATFDRTIALIYVACDGLNLSEASAFQDLLSDMHESQLDRLRRGMEERWPELFEIERTEECRQILIDLVEENLAELNARIAEFEGVTDATAQKDLTRDEGDVTPEGARLLNHIQKSRNGLSRGIASFTRYQNTCSQRDKGDPSGGQEPRRTKEAVPD